MSDPIDPDATVRASALASKRTPAAAVAKAAEQPAKLPAEDWARAKGHTQLAKPPAAWIFNATRTRTKWPRGFELTEAEYDAAVNDTLNTNV